MLSETWTSSEPMQGQATASEEDVRSRTPRIECTDAPYAQTLEACRAWLDDTHRRVTSRLLHGNPRSVDEQHRLTAEALPESIVFVPRSQPEHAHVADSRRLAAVGIVAAFSREQWFVQETAIQTGLGPSGRLQMRLRSEWVIGPPTIACRGLRPRKEPDCIVTATADVPLQSRQPRLLSCVVCYDDARIAG